MRHSLTSFTLSLCFGLLALQPAIAQKYTVTDLGTLPGGVFPWGSTSWGNGVNEFGQVTGYALVAGPCLHECMHAFLYSNGHMQDLGTLPGGHSSVGNAINDRERRRGWEEERERGGRKEAQVVGYSETADGNFHAFLYSKGEMHDLGTVPGGSSSFADAIDDSGEVTGDAQTADGSFHAFLYRDGSMRDLGTLPGGTYSTAYGISRVERAGKGRESVQVVGYADVPGPCNDIVCPYYHAFLYSKGAMHDLGTFPGGYSSASGINELGQVTGSSETSEGNFHAFLYDHGTMHDLGSLSKGFQSFGQAINRHGEVVGYGSVGPINNFHAFLYSKGKMQDLNSLIPSNSGWFLPFAYAINDRGQITGYGLVNKGSDGFQDGHAFLLTPVCTGDKDHDRDNDGCKDER